jgi:parallel beta-helix repeat protein
MVGAKRQPTILTSLIKNMTKFPCLLNSFASAILLLSVAAPVFEATAATKIIYISPQGVDNVTSGSANQPFRTISAAIVNHPQEGTVFQLADGSYSSTTGENFPILLPRGTVLRGNSANNGNNVIVNGGGRFVSSTFASQNIAIAAAHNSRIEGITVTNSNPRGYGLWLESSRNVAIANNSFTRNTHDGIFLTGNANAAIGNNLFVGNTGSGISALGTSTGEIRDNRFENTGFGLSIGQQSQVVLVNNNVSRNVDGIVISNNAQPILRGNVIADNQRNGLVVLSGTNGSPRPDLGTVNSVGNNTFRNNREFDINNATSIPIAFVGNQAPRIKGALDFKAATNSIPQISSPVIPAPVAVAPIPINVPNPAVNSAATVFIPAPPTNSSLPSSVVSTSGNPTAIVIERDYTKPAPTQVAVQVAVKPPAILDPTTGRSFQYRVVVPNPSSSTTQKVKDIVPSAFRLLQSGRYVLQVGAYSDRPAADNLVNKLAQSGLKAEIIPFR